eukprot:COSAG04_NODE_10029_length_812_cov_0.795231_1_plen_228_part_01
MGQPLLSYVGGAGRGGRRQTGMAAANPLHEPFTMDRRQEGPGDDNLAGGADIMVPMPDCGLQWLGEHLNRDHVAPGDMLARTTTDASAVANSDKHEDTLSTLARATRVLLVAMPIYLFFVHQLFTDATTAYNGKVVSALCCGGLVWTLLTGLAAWSALVMVTYPIAVQRTSGPIRVTTRGHLARLAAICGDSVPSATAERLQSLSRPLVRLRRSLAASRCCCCCGAST